MSRPPASQLRLAPALSCVLLALLLLAPGRASAQEEALQQRLQSWTLLSATGVVGESPWRWYGEVQPRVDASVGKVDRLLLRGAVGYQVLPSLSLWLGYAWTPLLINGFDDEQRPFQQSIFTHTTGPLAWTQRTRFEQRFIAGAEGVSLRLRHMARTVLPLGAGWGLAAYDELFVNVNGVSGGPGAGLDQNRAFLGANRQVGPVLLEAGYLNNLVWRPGADRMNHILLVMAAATFR